MKVLTTLFLSAISSFMFAQIPNPSFENWSSGNPDQWTTGNNLLPGTTTQSSNAYAGSSAVSLNNVGGFGGFVSTETITDEYFINSGNPAALNGWYILNSVGGDELQVIVATKCSSGDNGAATANITTATAVHKQFSVCISYGNSCTSDSASIGLYLVNQNIMTNAGSYVIVDDLSFGVCTATGVDAIKNEVVLDPSYPNPANTICNIIYYIPNSATVNVSLYDISGRKVMNILNNTNQTSGRYKIPVDLQTLANGVYFYTIAVDGVPYSQKLVVAK